MHSKKHVRVKLQITGHVQGVFYRKRTCEKAQSLHLVGYVKNQKDGSVECVVEGPKEKVDALIDYCTVGPPEARVDNVFIEPLALTEAPVEAEPQTPSQSSKPVASSFQIL